MVIAEVVALIAVFLFTVTIHEYAHGCAALALGDSTAKDSGRLSLNPLRHIDPFWTVVLPVTLVWLGFPAIGMARPVPVDFNKLRKPKRDMIWVGLAGPAANLAAAFVLSLLFHLTQWFVFLMGAYFNLGLAVFNLFPIPPLDGSRVLAGLLPQRLAYEYVKMERFGFVVILLLVWSGWLWKVLMPLFNLMCRVFNLPGVGMVES